MQDIPEQFSDVPRLPNGRPDMRTKRGKELKAYLSEVAARASELKADMADIAERGLDDRYPAQAPQKPAESEMDQSATAFTKSPESSPVATPRLCTVQAGERVLEMIAATWPEARYIDWNQVRATFRQAERNHRAWRKLTEGR